MKWELINHNNVKMLQADFHEPSCLSIDQIKKLCYFTEKKNILLFGLGLVFQKIEQLILIRISFWLKNEIIANDTQVFQ